MKKYRTGDVVEVKWPMLAGPVWIPATVLSAGTDLTTCKVDRNGLHFTIDFRPDEIRPAQFNYDIIGA